MLWSVGPFPKVKCYDFTDFYDFNDFIEIFTE